MKKNKEIIRVQPVYTILIWLILIIVFFAFLVFPIFVWEDQNMFSELWYILISILLTLSIIILVYYIQVAILNEEGIIIRGLFYTIAKIRWADINKIEERSIVTYDNRIPVLLKWFIIYIKKQKNVKFKRGGINKKNKAPWYIIATKKNREIIGKYYMVRVVRGTGQGGQGDGGSDQEKY
jgi:glucan phosphoethanolaminetransferase (alkaline phosphatase superfamily)